jgi:mannosyl-3-phosphoglycerate synthase
VPGKKIVGFVDADNLVPGVVLEYCRIFAAGFALASSAHENTMVRVKWASKPKVQENEICFDSEGRTSKIINSWLSCFVHENVIHRLHHGAYY